jgi:hypothetical protein
MGIAEGMSYAFLLLSNADDKLRAGPARTLRKQGA